MLSTKNSNVIKNPRIQIRIGDILNKVHWGTVSTIEIGSRIITIQRTPVSFANTMLLAMDQIRKDNPDKDIHFHIPYLDLQLEDIKDEYCNSILDKLLEINISMNKDFLDEDSFAKFKLKYANQESEKNYRNAIQLIVESVDKNTSISFYKSEKTGEINQIMYDHINSYGDYGHQLPCEFIRPFYPDKDNIYYIDLNSIYIEGSKKGSCDPKLNGANIRCDTYIDSIAEIDISGDSLDAALNLKNNSVIDYDSNGEPILGPNMISRCEYYVKFAAAGFTKQSNDSFEPLKIWYVGYELDPIYVISISGVEKIAKTIAFDQYVNSGCNKFTDAIDIMKFQSTIVNLIMSEIQRVADETLSNTIVIREPEIINYDFSDIDNSIMKINLHCNMLKKLAAGNSLHIKLNTTDNDNAATINIGINNIMNHICKYGIDLVKIDI